MFCNNCRAQIPDGSAVCPYCGAQQAQQPYQQPQYQQPYQQPQYQQPYQQPQYQQPYPQAYPQGTPINSQPMKWHKFLVYFALWAGAVLNIISGILALTGSVYGEEKELVYHFFPTMESVNVVYGILCVGLGIFGFYTAYNMLNFKKGAPKLLTILYAAACVISLVYIVAVFVIVTDKVRGLDTSDLWLTGGMNLAVSILMILVNNVYYKKREHLFVN